MVSCALLVEEEDNGPRLIFVAIHQDSSPFAALDCLLQDIEAGKEASDLEAPHEYRHSMVSLSDQSVVPARVSLRHKKLQGSQKVKTCNTLSAANISDTETLQSSSLPSSPTISLAVGVDHRASCVSTYSSSVYSEQSSATTSTRARRWETSISETKARFLGSEGTAADGITFKQPEAVGNHYSDSSAVVLTQEPLQLSQTKKLGLRKSSLTYHTETFLLDDSSSESKPPSQPSARKNSYSKGDPNEEDDKTSSAFASSESSENPQDQKTVSFVLASIIPQLITLNADSSPCCKRKGGKTARPGTSKVRTIYYL
jgi:hypothetical protein